jgi:glycosyltransferase involved in cell wall biosynthesis
MAAFPGKVDLLERGEKGGRGAAVIAAFKKGLADPRRYDYLFEMDADFSHHPREIGKFLRALKTHDMVIGSRYVPGGGTSDWGLVRAVLSWLANKYIAVVAGIPIKDTTSGYRGYRRSRARGHRLRPDPDQGLRRPRRDGLSGVDQRLPARRGPIHFHNQAPCRLEADPRGDLRLALFNFAALRFPTASAPGPRGPPEPV